MMTWVKKMEVTHDLVAVLRSVIPNPSLCKSMALLSEVIQNLDDANRY